jgi:hypothetical protein
MARKRHRFFILELVGFICALTLLVMSIAPLYNQETDARLLTVVFGAFGAGVMLCRLTTGKKQPDRGGQGELADAREGEKARN